MSSAPDFGPARLPPWWKTGVFYQIYPRSFSDSSGSGIGDLRGVTERIGYLRWLGVDAIWLSPFFPSPMCDFGYDVADYCAVDPLFGRLSDFDELVEAAHKCGIRVLLDWVPGHTSNRHPWFLDARSSRDNEHRDWYVWRDPAADGGPPNNWAAAFGDRGPAWTFDPTTGQYFLHSFLPQQPDLDWNCPEVVHAMHDVLRFWLDRGVDGFRADVIHNIGKDPRLLDVPAELAPIPHCVLNDDPRTHELLRGIRSVLDEYPGERVIVGEVFLLRTDQIAPYYGVDDELHLSFNFPPLFAEWRAEVWSACLASTSAALDPTGAWPAWVLSNHDQKRHRTRYGSEARARVAAFLLLTLRGTPFLYMGEELGLEDAPVPPERQLDPGGRDGCRAPIPWTEAAPYGWEGESWLPWPPDPAQRSVEHQRAQAGSMLHLYRRLLVLRRDSLALRQGEMERLPVSGDLLAYWRCEGAERRLIVLNFAGTAAHFESSEPLRIVLSSDGPGAGDRFEGQVAPDQALLLEPY